MTGCAGGLSGGLWAAFGATLVHGAGAILDAVGFDQRLDRASAVVTGEGRIDGQSLSGKITGEIARRGVVLGRPVHAIVAKNALTAEEMHLIGFASLTEATTLEAISNAASALAPTTPLWH